MQLNAIPRKIFSGLDLSYADTSVAILALRALSL